MEKIRKTREPYRNYRLLKRMSHSLSHEFLPMLPSKEKSERVIQTNLRLSIYNGLMGNFSLTGDLGNAKQLIAFEENGVPSD